MRALPELVAMLKGLQAAFRAVGSALLMLLLLVYVFGILLFVLEEDDQTLAGTMGMRYFGISLGRTMWTLLIDGAFLDNPGQLSFPLLIGSHYRQFFIVAMFIFIA